MKAIFFLTIYLLAFSNPIFSQILTDYPFKTFVDFQGNLYVTGKDQSNNILIRKYPPVENATYLWTQNYESPFENDLGVDVTVDPTPPHNVYVTGYVNDGLPDKFSTVVLALDNSDGEVLWSKKIANSQARDYTRQFWNIYFRVL